MFGECLPLKKCGSHAKVSTSKFSFIIEVKDVIPFKEFSPLELHDDIIMAFKKASAEYALQNSNKNYNEVLTSKTIESACDLCEFV